MRLAVLILFALLITRPAQAADRFLGVLELPALCVDACAGSDIPLPLYTAPYLEEPAQTIDRALYFADDPDVQNQKSPLWPDAVEFENDRFGAIVYESVPGSAWKIRIGGKDYWIKAADGITFYPYPEILEDRLTYFMNWDFTLWSLPGQQPGAIDHPYRDDPGKAARIPVRLISYRRVDGIWWLQVEIYKRSPCENPGQALYTKGWVPAYKSDGTRTAWYNPKGC